jgi:lipid-A-disaccharide synthase
MSRLHTQPNAPSLGLVAGEPSGDLLAGLMMAGLRQRWPALHAVGIGGPCMAEQGFKAWWPHDTLAVRGYMEVLLRYRELVGIRKQLGDRLLSAPPNLFIGVDAPDFNFGLEARLKAAGVKTMHFISPSIWAWRRERIEKIRQAVDHMLCVFPFEPALYDQAGIAATYVGHPLADAIAMQVSPAASRTALGLPAGLESPLVALLPGSRRSEIHHIGPRLLAAASEMHRQRPQVQYLLPIMPGMMGLLEPLLKRFAPGVPIHVFEGHSHEVLGACDVALVASGTATLEAALFKRPMVITYHMNWLEWQRMKRMRYQPWVGLPNILLEDFVVPELLQHDATPTRLATAVFDWLDHPARCDVVVQRFTQLHETLRCNTAQKATDAIEKILYAGTA